MSAWSSTRLPVAANWSAVAYGNGKFVAVESNNTASGKNIAYSTDGITWQEASAVSGYADFEDVAYGGEKFVAVGLEIYYSSNGINWSKSSASYTGVLNGITYGNGKFVAVSSAGEILYSTNGTNWSKTSSPVSGLSSVAYGSGLFVATSSADGTIIYSTNATSWGKVTTSSSRYFDNIAYGAGMFVAINRFGSAYRSTDGYTWTVCGIGSESWSGITYGDGKFVAAAESESATSTRGSNIVTYSEDGIRWIKSTLPSTARWSDVAYGNGKFVAISGGISTASITGAYISSDKIGVVTVTLAVDPSNGGTAAGAGTYSKGDSVTVKATPANGWEFVDWTENGTTVSTEASYTFTITGNRSLTAAFKQKLTAWVGISGKARKGVELYVGVNGKARKVTEAWIGVNGKARRFL